MILLDGSTVIASSASDEAIQAWLGALGCFAEPVIGPRKARTRWLAMTAIPSDLIKRSSADDQAASSGLLPIQGWPAMSNTYGCSAW